MGVGSPDGWAVAIFILGLVGLLLLRGRAKAWFEYSGVGFGFLRPREVDVERIFSAR
jgi:hypothetical protein